MKKSFELNGKNYPAIDFDYNTVADLSEMGINVEDFSKKQLPLVRAYISLCMGADKTVAGEEIGKHLEAGKDLSEVITIISERIENSDFFRRLSEKKEAKTTKN